MLYTLRRIWTWVVRIPERNAIRNVLRGLDGLNVTNAGVDADGDGWIEADGLRFHGVHPAVHRRPWHHLLPRRLREVIPPDCMEIAYDISLRYAMGALSECGIRKEQHYTIQRGDTVVEMGAYQGLYCMSLSGKVGPEGTVVAIEAMPQNIRLLKKNLAHNGIKNVRVVETGVWHEKAHMTFRKDPLQGQSASVILKQKDSDTVQVHVRPLHTILGDLGIKEVDQMVIQLNGAEPNALRGLGSIRPWHFALASRYENGEGSTTPQILDWLTTHGYKVIIEQE